MSSPITINYLFRFQNGESREISLQFDEKTMALLPEENYAPPEWVSLTLHQCTGCPLAQAQHQHCPSALHLSKIVDTFSACNSFDTTVVEVRDSRRHYIKDTSLQDGLGSLVGIIMATGGCPVLEPLRPMVRFHLPFASMEETEFRMVSMYLVAQYLRHINGKQPDWSLSGLQDIYNKVKVVNTSFALRIRAASVNDAGVNAIIILDCFAKAVPYAIKTMMRDYERSFDSYLK